jgi:3-oxoacyl-[acyl-carrier protein] reductase
MTQDTEKIALVTGAGKGIGRAVALALAGQGIFVYINYLSDRVSAAQTLEDIQGCNGQGALLPFDVTRSEDSKKAVQAILKDKGALHILVNNAGIRNDGLLAMMKEESWQSVINTNLTSFYNVTKPAVKQMLKNRSGRIVTLTSAAGQMGNAGQVNYSAAKSGLIGATKALAREVGNRNITVNAVSPGFIETRMLNGMDMDRIIETIPAKRLGRPEEVAHAVAFLCSDKAAYINGQILGVNGGLV